MGLGSGFQRLQRDLVGGGRQGRAGQVFGQQAAQVGHVLRGLRGAHLQGLAGRHVHAIDAAQ
ncbi:hypothetical protein, partial [Acidovorax delafieldii]|uniref:hypothetical protein n=1 Tax=Acidovorax delafieldii TaxID=47920 RepID=UPI001E31026F